MINDELTLNKLIKKSKALEQLLTDKLTDEQVNKFLEQYSLSVISFPLDSNTALEVYINHAELTLKDYKINYREILKEVYNE
jgi:hypothetical protein